MKYRIRKTCLEGIDLVKEFESFSSTIYICPAGHPTIGYGHIIWPWEDYSAGITEDEAEKLLRNDMLIAEIAVQKYINVELSDFQHGALVSFTFNLGAGALQRSTLRSKTNRAEFIDAADEFLRWVYAKGRKLRGLVRRREAERILFLAGTGESNGNGS